MVIRVAISYKLTIIFVDLYHYIMTRVWLHIIIYGNMPFGSVDFELSKQLYGSIAKAALASDTVILSLNGVHDHFHFLVHLGLNQAIVEVVGGLKAITRSLLSSVDSFNPDFEWNDEIFVFSVSSLLVDLERHCIENQRAYHCGKGLSEEISQCIHDCKMDYQLQ